MTPFNSAQFFYWTEISDLWWPHERIHFIFRSLQFFFWVFKKNQYESPSSGQFSYNFKACSILGALKLLNWKVCIQKAFYYFITLALPETNNFGNPKRHSFQETSCWNIQVAFLNYRRWNAILKAALQEPRKGTAWQRYMAFIYLTLMRGFLLINV